MESISKLAQTAAKAAGSILLENFGKTHRRSYKNDEAANTVTEIDVAANDAITSLIQREFPQHSILSEEAPLLEGDSEFTWVIDPLDGTNNYIHGMPQFSVSIGVLKDGLPYYGLVYQPIGERSYTAERGEGAFLNGKRIHVSKTERLSEALIGLGFYYDRGTLMQSTLRSIEDLFVANVHGVRRLGCASLDLCFVAQGIFDGFFEFTLSPWDYAAGALIVEEAGGKVSTVSGEPVVMKRCSLLASNSELYDYLQPMLQKRYSEGVAA